MKIAIVHEMLVKLGGAENVVQDIYSLFPQADLFTLIYDEQKVGHIFPRNRVHCKGPAQTVYKLTKKQRLCLPFMAQSVEQIDLSSYDLVIASSSGFAHGCITQPETPFVVYSHSPARYLWDYTHQYPKDIGWGRWLKKIILSHLTHQQRLWDFQAGQRADCIVAASKQVQNRIQKYYRRPATVVYPAVETEAFFPGKTPLHERSYYVIASALTEFKKVHIAVREFSAQNPKIELVIAGDGHDAQHLKNIAGSNIHFVGRQNAEQLNRLYSGARGFIMCGQDDFGIAPVEAMAAGIPVFALAKGGLLETSLDGVTGRFFENAEGVDFWERFLQFDAEITHKKFTPSVIRARALEFRRERFLQQFSDIVSSLFSEK